jgi:8-oxo-dGTP pyrophosphatase MutT (NUDIX family)
MDLKNYIILNDNKTLSLSDSITEQDGQSAHNEIKKYNTCQYVKKKVSVGLVICKNDPPQVLMIKKRITNAYKEFIFGKYKFKDNNYILYLFNRMTVNEKIIIMSKDFDKNWYFIWLKIPTIEDKNIYEFYLTSKSKYSKIMLNDNCKRIKLLLLKSTNTDQGWEIPGGHIEPNETEIDAAIREVREETNMDSSKYKLLSSIKPLVISGINNKTLYIRKYYVASFNSDSQFQPGVKFYNNMQVSEISDVRWISMIDIARLPFQQHNIRALAKRALKLYKKNTKTLILNKDF